MRHLIIFFCCLLLIISCKSKEVVSDTFTPPPPPVIKNSPEEIEFITSDIDLFWKMYDRELPLFTKMEVDSQYFEAGTPALQLFYEEKIKSSGTFSNLLNNRFDRRYFENIRDNTMQFDEQRAQVVSALQSFEELYPEAVFTDIVFVIGGLDTGGTLLSNGQIVIAAEMFAKNPDMELDYLSPWLQSVLRSPDDLPVIAMHELVHLQQRQHLDPEKNQSLLDRAILEGSADFITNLILGTFLTESLHAYADPREEKLWKQFNKAMNGGNFSKWLYNGNAASGRPADLGYYMGFKIAESYYQNATDKKQAVRDIIQMNDGKAFLKKSGYADSF